MASLVSGDVLAEFRVEAPPDRLLAVLRERFDGVVHEAGPPPGTVVRGGARHDHRNTRSTR